MWSYHCSISQDTILGCHIGSIGQDLLILHQHIIQRHPHILQSKVAIVNSLHTQFGANVSDVDSGHRLMSVGIPKLDNEGRQATELALGVELSNNHSMVGRVTHYKRTDSFKKIFKNIS